MPLWEQSTVIQGVQLTPNATFKVYSSGVDWITVTTTTLAGIGVLVRAAEAAIGEECQRGGVRRPHTVRNYHGWKANGVSYGVGVQGCIAQATSDAAAKYWRSLLLFPCNVTRLDLQVTVSGVPLDQDLADQGYRQMEQHGPKTTRIRTYSRYTTHPAGATLYLGSPASDSRWRLYDKWAESKGTYPAGTWRYEHQTRSSVAGSIASALDSRDKPERSILRHVHDSFTAAGIVPCYSPSGRSLSRSVPRDRTDTARTLRWLRDQVAPALRRLERSGSLADGYTAMGIGQPAGGRKSE
jgi:hypothetical protein